MTVHNGIDVSQWQGVIDWEKVKAAGVDFAMIRAGYGDGNIDPRFHRNISECNRLGIPCGVYWFSYAHTVSMAVREAQHCIAAIKAFRLDYPVAFDFEYDSVERAADNGVTMTKALASGMARGFCNTVRGAGYTPMVYANPDFLSRFFDTAIPRDYPLWLAQWPGKKPDPSQCPREADIWQWGTGMVDGIVGQVDMDFGYADYGAVKDAPPAWAKAAADYCVRKGIIRGDGSGNYHWNEPVTKAQAAQLIYNTLEAAGQLADLPDK